MLTLMRFVAHRYGKKSMLWWIMVCSMIGGISVSVTTGLGAAIVTTAQGDNQVGFTRTFFVNAIVDTRISSSNSGSSTF
jgi:magnesium transporter